MELEYKHQPYIIVILAAGMGKRMRSDLPKVVHNFNGKPMITKIVNQCIETKPTKIIVIIGKETQCIRDYVPDNELIVFATQEQPLGTGHALMACSEHLTGYDADTTVTVICGDTPLIQSSLISATSIPFNERQVARILAFEEKNPYGYGRIIMDDGIFQKIVEEKECSDKEKLVTTVNSGVYSFNINCLLDNLFNITNDNATGEFYLTDIFEIIVANKNDDDEINVTILDPHLKQMLKGVNTPEQLKELELEECKAKA
jgi:UDP-N-acetylglucosamine diphosphorylase/glucosamine-1-phosphate N-acetyltransferase